MGFRNPIVLLSELVADVLTGAYIRTAETGGRIEIHSEADARSIRFYDSGTEGKYAKIEQWDGSGEGGEIRPAMTLQTGSDDAGLRSRLNFGPDYVDILVREITPPLTGDDPIKIYAGHNEFGAPSILLDASGTDPTSGVVVDGNLFITGGLGGLPYSYKTASAGTVVTNATWTKITSLADNGGTSGIGFASNAWTIQRAGRYLGVFRTAFPVAGAAGHSRGTRILKDGVEVEGNLIGALAGNSSGAAIVCEFRADVGEVIELQAFQVSGGTLTTNGAKASLRYVGN